MSVLGFILWNILIYICKAYPMQSVINSWPEILYRKLLTYMPFAQFVLMGGLTYYVIILLKWQKEFHSQSLPKFVDSFTIPQTAWSHRIPILGWKLPHLFVTKCHHILECTYIMWMFPILLRICTHKYTQTHTHTHTHLYTLTQTHTHSHKHNLSRSISLPISLFFLSLSLREYVFWQSGDSRHFLFLFWR